MKTKTKTEAPDVDVEMLAMRLRVKAEWLASELARRGARPEEQICQYVPDGDCSNCAGDLPDCWLVAAEAAADEAEMARDSAGQQG